MTILNSPMAISSTSYPKKWKSGKTTVIRVPEKLASAVIEIARRLDGDESYVLREEPIGSLFPLLDEAPPRTNVGYQAASPVNVASVPQRSPFRYPGGKTWLVPYLRDWLRHQKPKPARLIEPFAGGAIASLTAGFESLVRHVIFAELDERVAAVWQVVLSGQADWLAQRILDFEVTVENVRLLLDREPGSLRERAFQTMVRNRVQRGGILAPGAGLVKTGENGRGMKSRWYPATLARRIREIHAIRDRFTFLRGDAFQLIKEHRDDKSAVFYVDPPYTLAAKRLYPEWQVNHERLFALMAGVRGDFLMSYDHTSEVVELARRHGFETRGVAMKNTHHAKMQELLIGRDLSWLD
jgi:DNA adenine methylase